MKKSVLGGLVALVLVVAACQPTKPPPPPPTPPDVDVLLVGDSVGFGVGCMLGDNGPDNVPCPPKPGFSTFNGYLGACAVAEGHILLYNHTAVEGNCNHPSADASTLWPQAVNLLNPELVVIVTGGWEIVDRWSPGAFGGCNPVNVGGCAQADLQFAGAGAFNTAAINNYKTEMTNVINAMRAQPSQPKVLLLDSPYVNPACPDPSNSWWEAYPATQPVAGQPIPFWDNAPPAPPGNPCLTSPYPQSWFRPNAFTPYKSSKAKINAFNNAVHEVANSLGPDVEWFDFNAQFSPNGDFNFYLCPPPNNTADPDNCPGGAEPILARLNDAGHLTGAGNELLGQLMLSQVYDMLGIPEP